MNLSNWVLTYTEINVLEKRYGIHFYSEKLNESEITSGFNEFRSKLDLKWHFWDAPENLIEVPVFTPKSRYKPPQGHPYLEAFLSQEENEFELLKIDIQYSNLSKEGWNLALF